MNTKTLTDMKLDIYSGGGISLQGIIKDGCLHLTSEVWGDDYDSEKHYVLTREDTEKLFSIIEVDEFIEECREGHTLWMEDFFEMNGIDPDVCSV